MQHRATAQYHHPQIIHKIQNIIPMESTGWPYKKLKLSVKQVSPLPVTKLILLLVIIIIPGGENNIHKQLNTANPLSPHQYIPASHLIPRAVQTPASLSQWNPQGERGHSLSHSPWHHSIPLSPWSPSNITNKETRVYNGNRGKKA